ncbi:hypothetical protein PA25_24820 [Pseudoalteromonas sp. A25]|uniref:hypothetical protein n=1 Tax=Pseudoalteromonas sp. A25 TaxID=116092 RepID=UPI001260FA80|nr:hypothetical protein [Pseudoalteromonas sp. A25]BBN82497.1 hypothetical protein PA25_24820 [Pseudoalteromonas sp. A25]
MENIGSIAITAFITLLVTVLAGVLLEYFKRVRPKLKYSIKESIPIDLDDKKIGANIIEISNPSAKTVKDIVVKLRARGSEIKNGGVKTVTGMDYEVIESEDTLEIKIPFLKFKDYLSITLILEGKYSIPNKPEITVRSPDNFKLIEEGEKADKGYFSIASGIVTPAIMAAVTVSLALTTNVLSSRSEQGVNLAIAAAVVGLPEIAQYYVSNDKIYYYNQGPFIYSMAKSEVDKTKIPKYGDFLEKTLKVAPRINSNSEAALQFFIAKIRSLEKNDSLANDWFIKSEKTDKAEYNQLVEYFKSESPNN